jgi:4-hydroxy-3-methylbut-2-enyl diphosphate reductase
MIKRIILARHMGFCMGVKRAITIASETAAERLPNEKVTILKEIVHNEAVVESFRHRHVGQASTVAEVDEGTLIVSAHGVSPAVVNEAERKGLRVVNATCPLVSRIYKILRAAIAEDSYIIHFGEKHHDETTGIVGHAPDRITVVASEQELLDLPDWPERQLGLTVQTTAHATLFRQIQESARTKWPQIRLFDTVCNATTQRQSAILELAPQADMILVVGSRTSANSKRLVKISQAACRHGHLIGSSSDIDLDWFVPKNGIETIGLSAGASTPTHLVEEVIDRLVALSGGTAEIVRPPKPAAQGEEEDGFTAF